MRRRRSKFALFAEEVGWWPAVLHYLRAYVRTSYYRAVNRWRDLLAVCSGYCNDRPWSPIPGEGGGYADWRCALRRGHAGLHRARNYTWPWSHGGVDYDPIPVPGALPRQPWERYMMPTSRQARAWSRYYLGRHRPVA